MYLTSIPGYLTSESQKEEGERYYQENWPHLTKENVSPCLKSQANWAGELCDEQCWPDEFTGQVGQVRDS